MTRNRHRLSITLVLLALLAVAFGMFFSSSLQRSAAIRADSRTQEANQLATGMLDQETGVRGFLLNGRDEFLDPFRDGYEAAVRSRAKLTHTAGDDAQTLLLVRRHQALHHEWRSMALVQIAIRRSDATYRGVVSEALQRKTLMDGMRQVTADINTRLEVRRDEDLASAGRASAIVILFLTVLIGLGVVALLRTEARRRAQAAALEAGYRQSQQEFTDIVQVVGSEHEGRALLKRHLELSLHGATATVLGRVGTEGDLEALTPVAADSAIAAGLEDGGANGCLAVRLGRPQRSDGTSERLVSCALCGATGKQTACEPLLSSGQVTGAVLVELSAPLDEPGERRVHDSVAQAAPVLANLRNLALAEQRASTDALTGLPNRRAVQSTLAMLAAQASRQVRPLAAITIDLDRFKDINDRFGHDIGDAVLEHTASILRAGVRASDFCGRLGGEEFVVFAPDTGVEGAKILAENLRTALERDEVPGVDRPITASFGIAVIPDHAMSADVLMRLSDRALYAAKSGGRNRVEVVDERSETPTA